MRVNLAAQILSETVGNVLNNFSPAGTEWKGKFCVMMDKLFACLNVRSTKKHNIKTK